MQKDFKDEREMEAPRAKVQMSPFEKGFNDTKSAAVVCPYGPQHQQRFVNVTSAPDTAAAL